LYELEEIQDRYHPALEHETGGLQSRQRKLHHDRYTHVLFEAGELLFEIICSRQDHRRALVNEFTMQIRHSGFNSSDPICYASQIHASSDRSTKLNREVEPESGRSYDTSIAADHRVGTQIVDLTGEPSDFITDIVGIEVFSKLGRRPIL
jgi:hypothetical protein